MWSPTHRDTAMAGAPQEGPVPTKRCTSCKHLDNCWHPDSCTAQDSPMSCQSPCKTVGWLGAVTRVQSAQKQSRASGSSSLPCLRAFHKKLRRLKSLLSVESPSALWKQPGLRKDTAAQGRPNSKAPTATVAMGTGDRQALRV